MTRAALSAPPPSRGIVVPRRARSQRLISPATADRGISGTEASVVSTVPEPAALTDADNGLQPLPSQCSHDSVQGHNASFGATVMRTRTSARSARPRRPS
jgi:hypothetical protein